MSIGYAGPVLTALLFSVGLLDKKKGGGFSILPVEEYTSHQYYLENTNVLITEITTKSGEKYRITDFAPRFYEHQRVLQSPDADPQDRAIERVAQG